MRTEFEPQQLVLERQRLSVALNSLDEVRYWCERLGCNEGRLREALAHVGASAADVAAFIHGDIPFAFRAE